MKKKWAVTLRQEIMLNDNTPAKYFECDSCDTGENKHMYVFKVDGVEYRINRNNVLAVIDITTAQAPAAPSKTIARHNL
jgi:hypothetical protein